MPRRPQPLLQIIKGLDEPPVEKDVIRYISLQLHNTPVTIPGGTVAAPALQPNGPSESVPTGATGALEIGWSRWVACQVPLTVAEMSVLMSAEDWADFKLEDDGHGLSMHELFLAIDENKSGYITRADMSTLVR